MFGTSWKIFSNTVLISDKLSSFFLKKNIAKKKNHSKFLKNAFVGENEIRKLKKSSFYAFFFVLPKNYGNESQPTKHKKIKYPHFSWKKKYCQMDLLNFLQHFSPRKIETFFFLTKESWLKRFFMLLLCSNPICWNPLGFAFKQINFVH